MIESNLNSKLNSNFQSYTDLNDINTSNENDNNIIYVKDEIIKENNEKIQRKSHKKSKEMKKRKKNRHIRIACKNKAKKNSSFDLNEKSSNKSDTPKKSKFKDLGNKILTKIYLPKLVEKKKLN